MSRIVRRRLGKLGFDPVRDTAAVISNMRITRPLLFAIALAVGAGCAKQDWIDRTLVTENVSGTWSGTVGGRAILRLDLQHTGPKVTGLLKWLTGAASGPVEGSVAGDVFTFKTARGTVSGELTINGDEMTGQIIGWPLGGQGTRMISLQRENVSSGANPLTR